MKQYIPSVKGLKKSNNPFKNLIYTCFVCVSIISCDKNFDNPIEDEPARSSGSADFSTFVSIGDSITAGYADAALYRSGQENSYPAILAEQFARAGGGNFFQPLMNDNLGGLLFSENENPEFANRLVLDAEALSPEPIAGAPTTEVIDAAPLTGPFNNVGVPGAKSFHLAAEGLGNPAGLATDPLSANPYYVRFASSATSSIIGDAAAQQPTFFILWIGNNDILSYATSGGIGVDQTNPVTDPATYGSNDITNTIVFDTLYGQLLGAMTTASPDAKGVLVNVPDVTTIPYFTTVPYNAVPLDQATADTLNAAYTAYNDGLELARLGSAIDQTEKDAREISFVAGQNPVVILDEDLTDLTGLDAALVNMRLATAEDLVILPTRTKIGQPVDPTDENSLVWGVSAPLLDGDVLTKIEVATVETARTAFNTSIQTAADADDDLIMFDVAAVMTALATTEGIALSDGSNITATYATGGAFSLDGVHPTSRGYAVIANRMISDINSNFGANVPTVAAEFFPTIYLK